MTTPTAQTVLDLPARWHAKVLSGRLAPEEAAAFALCADQLQAAIEATLAPEDQESRSSPTYAPDHPLVRCASCSELFTRCVHGNYYCPSCGEPSDDAEIVEEAP